LSLWVGALFVLSMTAAGWWPMLRLAGAWAGPSRLERGSVALALGAAATGLCQLALSAAGVPSAAVVPATLAAASLLLCRFAPGEVQPAEPAAPLAAWVRVLLLAVALVSLGAAIGAPFSADGVRIWAAKSRDLALAGASEAPSLHDPERFGVHRRYPLLVPSLLAPVFAHAPPDAAAGPKLVLAALNLALVGVLSALLRRCGPRGLALLPAAASAPFLLNLEVRESAVAGGYADSTDALFLLLVVAALLRLRSEVRPARALLLLGLTGAALLSTKLEGGVELLIALAAATLAGGRRGAVLGGGALALLLSAPTLLIRAGVAAGDEGFDLSSLIEIPVLLARAVPVASGLAGLLVDASSFALLPALLLLWLLQRAPDGPPTAQQRAVRAFGLWVIAGALAFLAVAYLTTWMIPSRHVYTSAHRLAWHWLPALAVVVARLGPGADIARVGPSGGAPAPVGVGVGVPGERR
jgi:hypothetical protein